MSAGLNWFYSFVQAMVSNLNFPIVNGVGLLDVLISLTLLGIIIRNFVHSAR